MNGNNECLIIVVRVIFKGWNRDRSCCTTARARDRDPTRCQTTIITGFGSASCDRERNHYIRGRIFRNCCRDCDRFAFSDRVWRRRQRDRWDWPRIIICDRHQDTSPLIIKAPPLSGYPQFSCIVFKIIIVFCR